MKLIISTIAFCLFLYINHAESALAKHNKIVCFWNSTSFERHGLAKFTLDDLSEGIKRCTHLVYGFAGIGKDHFDVLPLHPHLDTGVGFGHYKLVNKLVKDVPGLKSYISIGGNADPYEESHKYLRILESESSQNKFIESVLRFLTEYHFDGVDLAWQFPLVKVQVHRGTWGSLWHGFKSTLGYKDFEDKAESKHRDGFTTLVHKLYGELKRRGKDLTMTVLPHTNSSAYYDIRNLALSVDAVHLFALDQGNPERCPHLADYPAPLYELLGRKEHMESIDEMVRHWLHYGTPSSKVVVGVPTYGRTWALSADSQTHGVPPLKADGPGEGGPHTHTPGIMSYAEICTQLTEHSVGHHLTYVNETVHRFQTYAYQNYNKDTKQKGIWIGYDGIESARMKSSYIKLTELAGVAIYDLSMDDFHGVCFGEKFPYLRAYSL